jgi:hypothetical protein
MYNPYQRKQVLPSKMPFLQQPNETQSRPRLGDLQTMARSPERLRGWVHLALPILYLKAGLSLTFA